MQYAMPVKYTLVLGISVFITATHGAFDFARPRIIGSNEAQPHEFPYMVTLYRDARPHHYCSGAILNENWVLTAAHYQLPKNKCLQVNVGKHSLSSVENTEQVVDVSRFIVHKNDRNPFGENDIALLKLERPLILNEYVKPVTLPKKGRNFVGQTFFSGWGYTDNNRLPDKLQKASLSIIDINVCKQTDILVSNQPSSIVANKMLCTGPLTGEISLCEGDSDGPLVKRQDNKTMIVGVASFTLNSCGQTRTASVYTKVSFYVDWMQNIMANN